MTASIIGWAHTAFGKHPDQTLESMIVAATRQALEHAQVDPAEIDEIFVGHFNSGDRKSTRLNSSH